MTDGLPLEAYLGAMGTLSHAGSVTQRRLLALGPPAEVWERIRAGRLPGAVVRSLPPAVRAHVAEWAEEAAQPIRAPERLWERCEQLGLGAVSLGSPGYPAALLDDPDPPVVLFHRGDPDVLIAPRVAVVGTRRATSYGLRVAHDLGHGLAAAGVCVVSGLALGIDAAAHRGAVQGAREGGVGPAAVVGGGLHAPGPARNAALARDVAEVGVVLSECPPDTVPEPWRFPVRNRILAGLGQALVVVESAPAGGSMLTVREAQQRDRPILAVPGPVGTRSSAGTNLLLSEGAIVCTGLEDVLAALGSLGPAPGAAGGGVPTDPRPSPTGDAARVLDELGWRPASLERLAGRTGLALRPLSAAIGALERGGWVQRRSGVVERIARPVIRGNGGDRT